MKYLPIILLYIIAKVVCKWFIFWEVIQKKGVIHHYFQLESLLLFISCYLGNSLFDYFMGVYYCIRICSWERQADRETDRARNKERGKKKESIREAEKQRDKEGREERTEIEKEERRRDKEKRAKRARTKRSRFRSLNLYDSLFSLLPSAEFFLMPCSPSPEIVACIRASFIRLSWFYFIL